MRGFFAPPARMQAKVPNVSTSGALSPPPGFTPPGSVLFQSDFESNTVGASPGGGAIGWLINVNTSVTPNCSITYSSTQSHSTSKAIEFYFSAGGASAPCGNYLAELDFDLGALYREVTFQYWMYIPSNYAHYASGSSNNNKFFRISPTYPASAGTERLGASTERSSDFVSDLAGEWDRLDGSGFTAVFGGSTSNFITAADFGTWMKVTWYVKSATAYTTGPGVFKLWKNDTLLIDVAPNIYDPVNLHAFRHGYLLGAVNSYRNGDTRFYMDDMIVWGNP